MRLEAVADVKLGKLRARSREAAADATTAWRQIYVLMLDCLIT